MSRLGRSRERLWIGGAIYIMNGISSESGQILHYPSCGSQYRQIRNGKTTYRRLGFLCRDRGHRYCKDPRCNANPAERRKQAVRLYLEQNGFRRIWRLLHIYPQNAANGIQEG
jgi:transposase-like protein